MSFEVEIISGEALHGRLCNHVWRGRVLLQTRAGLEVLKSARRRYHRGACGMCEYEFDLLRLYKDPTSAQRAGMFDHRCREEGFFVVRASERCLHPSVGLRGRRTVDPVKQNHASIDVQDTLMKTPLARVVGLILQLRYQRHLVYEHLSNYSVCPLRSTCPPSPQMRVAHLRR